VLGRAAEHARRAGNIRLETVVLPWAFLALDEGPTPVDEAIQIIRGSVEGHAGDRLLAMLAGRHLAQLEAMRGRTDEARRLIDEAIATGRDLGMRVSLGAGLLRARSTVAILSEDLGRAEADLREAVEILAEAEDWGHLASVAPDLALMRLRIGGREQEALEAIELGWPTMIEDDVDAQVRARSAKALYLSRVGEIDEAEELARDAVRRAWLTDYVNLRALAAEALADVLFRAGRPGDAAEELEKAIEVHRAKGNVMAAEADRRLLAQRAATAGKDR
jgi:tetratricopeptide (TPR) repeat protein